MGTPLCVLIAAHSATDAELVLGALRQGGFDPLWERVNTAESMQAALARRPWDIVIADYSDPHFSGPAALQVLRASGIDLPFILVSNRVSEDVLVAMMRAGAHDYVMKDSLARLPAAVEREVQSRREHTSAHQALRDSEVRTRAILDTAVDGIITIDERGIVQSFNPAAEKQFGYAADEVIGQNLKMLLPSPDRERHDGYLTAYLHSGVKKIIGIGREVVGQRKDGAVFPLDLAVSEVMVSGRRLFTGIVRDLTARKRAEDVVRDLEKRAQQRERLADIGAITAELVHDIGNPLSGISMQAQLILHRAKRDPAQAVTAVVQPVERILGEVRRLDSLIKEFMDFSREQRLDLKPVDVPRFLQDVLDLWRPVAAARRITIAIDAPGRVPPLTADEEKLRRVIDNLVKNAIEAIDDGPGQVGILVTHGTGESVRISVTDTGPGIPETVQVFRLFETTKTYGTGIGLAVARQIVQAHRGTIEYARREPTGTVFHVELPRRGPLTAAK